MNLSKNNFTTKTGEFIGQALLDNPSYPLYKLQFEDINLEEDGLVRVLQGVNGNKNILKLHIGITTDRGLHSVAEILRGNNTLEEIIIQETKDPQKLWSQYGRNAMTNTLRSFTQLKKVKIVSDRLDDDEELQVFKQEIDFYTSQKSGAMKKDKAQKERQESCDNTHMFESLLKLVESKDKNQKMPVRQFYKNTFNTLLNDAIFNLKKKQSKESDNVALFTHEGQVKEVAFYILANLPDGELVREMSDQEAF